MNISIHYDKRKLCHISITGEFEGQQDEAALVKQLEAAEGDELHITFLDAGIIGPKLAEKLQKLQTQGSSIYVLKSYLYSYLYNLGIQSYFIPRKVLPKPQENGGDKANVQDTRSFLHAIKDKYGYDYTQYQEESIMRRIKACMLREGFKSNAHFQRAVLADERLFEQLFLHFSVNTTEFFRNPEVFSLIRNKLLPYLDSYPHIKIWCAGCSTGQEPYSLAMLLHEMNMLDKTQIYATDINHYTIEEAKNGLYPTKNLENNISNYRKSGGSGSFMDYFTPKGDYLEIDRKLQDKILFFQHSLGGSGVLNEFQLILCRNVMIYFTPAMQKDVLENFSASLDQNGFLVLGKSEGILHNQGEKYFYPVNKTYKIYKKR